MDRKNTSGTLNRNDSQSQLTNLEPLDGKEVELKAQRDEHSQLFQDSLQQSSYTAAAMNDTHIGSSYINSPLQNSYGGVNPHMITNRSIGGHPAVKITINLEDALLEE